MKNKVVIIQEFIPPYRVPFFDRLNVALNGNLTLYVARKNADISCEQRHLKIRSKAGFKFDNCSTSEFADYDVVVMMFDLRWFLLYRLLFRLPKKTVLWGHGMGQYALLARVKAILIKRSMGFIAYESDGADYFEPYGVERNKLAYMGNTVEVCDYHFSEKDRCFFTYMGRLQPRKRLSDFLKAYALLSDEHQSRAQVLILGDGEIKFELEVLSKKLGISSKCRFVPGVYDQREIGKWLEKSIAYVSPGHVGLGVLHTFAYGVPVITRAGAPHAPEVCNVIDGETGFLVGDTLQALVESMALYMSDPEQHMRHCRAAYKRYANERTMAKMVGRFVSGLEQFTSNSSNEIN